ncbi:MAG: peptide chain release factor N(5)-glutamine methyltransferase [Geminicoccaceae bacterium]|nr:peptide chain release factor N(5)-glutamine methyltransferase [Geminicoccaceae bacterium]
MSSVARALAAATQRLREAGIECARAEARILLARASGLPREALLGAGAFTLDPETRARFEALVARRASREPMAYVLGRRAFWTLELDVAPGVLVPRPETETLVEAALEAFPQRDSPLRVLDLGTGSGCLLAAVLSEFPKAFGVGVDRCPRALALARANLEKLGLAARAALLCADWGRALVGRFALVVCNPPYVASSELARLDPEVARFEPRAALDGGPDGLDAYRALLPDLPRLLAPEGIVCLEVGAGQAERVRALAESRGFAVTPRADLAGIPRCLVLRRAPSG